MVSSNGRAGTSPDDEIKTRAWVASGTIDAQGRRCALPESGALTIVAVSVHAGNRSEIEERIALMREVVQSTQTPQSTPSLWVYPAGFFGFDAATMSWPGADLVRLCTMLPSIVQAHPPGAWVAFGVDSSVDNQQAWLIRAASSGMSEEFVQHEIGRHESSPAERSFDLDGKGLKAAFFVCSEIADYRSQFSDCRLIVDLAHAYVPGTVWSHLAGARMLHQRELTAVAAHGAAVLTHHHTGDVTKAGGEHYRHQSNWILFRGDGTDWLDRENVIPVPQPASQRP